jgi:putative DNA-invertase from lambdoid prophage Rac
MNKYAERRGWQIVASLKDVNGGAKVRPKREELIQMARRRKLNVIVVWRLDRWGRSSSDLTHTLEELRSKKAIAEQLGIGRASVYRAVEAVPSRS